MIQSFMRTVRACRKQVQAFLLASCIGAAVLAPCASLAQNLGTTIRGSRKEANLALRRLPIYR